MGLTRLKSMCHRAVVLLETRGDHLFVSFLVARGCPHSLAQGCLLSSKPAMVGLVFVMCHHSDADFSFPAFFKDSCDYLGSTLITRKIFLFLKSID